MKRKAKQKRSHLPSANPTHNAYDSSCKPDGPRTRSSNESQEHSKSATAHSVVGSETGIPTRGRPGRSISDSDSTGVVSGVGKHTARGRRARTVASPTTPGITESRSCLFTDDQTTPSSDYKAFDLPPSLSQDYEQEDAGAPELVAMHDLSVSSTPSTFVEPRHFVDKNDVSTLHNPRRLNKRELKALLKQTKKTRTLADENIRATVEQLADKLKDGCTIDLNPAPPKPIRIASPPPYTSAIPSITKRGSSRGRAGRKGRGGRRGGTKLGMAAPEQTPLSSIPASWVPLILPCQASGDQSALDVDPLRLHFKPWLNELSEARLHRFSISVRQILSQYFPSDPVLTSYPLMRPATATNTTPRDAFDSSLQVSTQSLHLPETYTATSAESREPAQEPVPSTACLSTSTLQLPSEGCTRIQPLLPHSGANQTVGEICPNEPVVTSAPPNLIATTNQAELKDVAASSYPYATPSYRPRGRGRGRGRRFNRSSTIVPRGASTRGGYQTSGTSTMSLAANPATSSSLSRGTTTPVRSKPRVSRELRGLVTWDAVMAQQRRQQELGADTSADKKAKKVSDALLAVTHDMLAAAAVDEDTGPSRTRRTRQSSGSAFSQSGPSTFHSDSGSAATGSVPLETNYRPKTVDVSSTARSGISTESSSVSSDLFTSTMHGFEPTEEHLRRKASELSPVASASHQITKLEHKEIYSHHDTETSSAQPTPPSCGDPLGSLGPVKYSPISTDQDPDLSHTADVDLLPEKPFEKVIDTQKRISSHKRRGRKQTTNLIQPSHSTESTPSTTYDKQEHPADLTTSEMPVASEPLASLTPASNSGKRRRQPLQSPSANALSESLVPSTSMDSSDWSGLPSSTEAISGGIGTLSSTGTRRTAGARSAALPPRKRYKVGIDTSTAPTLSSTQLTQDNSADTVLHPVPETEPIETPFAPSNPSPPDELKAATVLSPAPTSFVSTDPVKKRGRGRPSRRGAMAGATRPVPVVSAPSPTHVDTSLLSLDRPKREAAAIGFASLVAANLNNSTAQAGSVSSIDSPTRRPPANDLSSSVGAAITDASQDSSRLTMAVVSTPRGRGRPPRPKALTATSTEAVSLDAGEVAYDVNSSSSSSSTTRRKRSANVLSSDSATCQDVVNESSQALGHLNSKADSNSVAEPPAKKVSRLSGSPRATVRRKLAQAVENGELSTETPTEMPWKVFVDQLSNKILTPSRNGESQKGASDLDSVHTEQSTSHSTEPSSEPLGAKSTTLTRGRKGRPRIHDHPHGRKPLEVSVPSPVTKSVVRPSALSTLASLPGRAHLFKGHSLNDPVQLGTNPDAPCKGPLCDLFLRFLNEPDPSDPTCRLAAPIVYLPTPERNPEFFRFVISSYSSGSGFRIRFSDTLLRRLFTASSGSPVPPEPIQSKGDEALFNVEFPSLCLASIARRLYDQASLQASGEDLADWLHAPNGLTESELACVPLDVNDTENCLPLLDAAIESLLTVWESFAGRRSWLGRRLVRLRAVYTAVRSECALSIAKAYELIVPPLKATAVLNLPYYKPLGPGTKKKCDRRALERGAEVIRCLCGFRVEGGHVMVQCDHCAAWQHLPCLWWALNQAIKGRVTTPTVRSLCEAALIAAQAAGSGYLSELVGTGSSAVPEATTDASPGAAASGKGDGSEPPYFCPMCLNLQELTLEYPRSLSAAMAMDDLSSVFSLQETIIEGEHEFWSLASPDGHHQIRTDDYAFINRTWLQFCQSPTSFTATKRADVKQADQGCAAAEANPIGCAYDRLIIRIYRLWKDSSGKPWLEGGLFLRPYDVVQPEDPNSEKNFAQCRLWHHREVIYDEASRLVLPLTAWYGRCVVLCPSAYRTGRPADLLSAEEAARFLGHNEIEPKRSLSDSSCCDTSTTLEQLFFVCDKLFERTPGSGAVGYRFDEISPGYLKVNTRAYCFFRKPDVPGFGRPNLQREFTAAQLLELDRTKFVAMSQLKTSESDTRVCVPSGEVTASSSQAEQPKGAKLAKLVAWLESKRQQDAKVNACQLSKEKTASSTATVPTVCAPASSVSVSIIGPVRSHSGRGRPPRGSRGRGRPPRTASVVPLAALTESSQAEVPAQPAALDSTLSHVTEITVTPISVSEPIQKKEGMLPTGTSALSETDPSISSNHVDEPVSVLSTGGKPAGDPTSCDASNQARSVVEFPPLTVLFDTSSQSQTQDQVTSIIDVHQNSLSKVESPSPVVSTPITDEHMETAESDSVLVSSIPVVTQSQASSSGGRETPKSRRKRVHLRKRTTSEPKPVPVPLPVTHPVPQFLSDSEAAEPVVPVRNTIRQTGEQSIIQQSPPLHSPSVVAPFTDKQVGTTISPDAEEKGSVECFDDISDVGTIEQPENVVESPAPTTHSALDVIGTTGTLSQHRATPSPERLTSPIVSPEEKIAQELEITESSVRGITQSSEVEVTPEKSDIGASPPPSDYPTIHTDVETTNQKLLLADEQQIELDALSSSFQILEADDEPVSASVLLSEPASTSVAIVINPLCLSAAKLQQIPSEDNDTTIRLHDDQFSVTDESEIPSKMTDEKSLNLAPTVLQCDTILDAPIADPQEGSIGDARGAQFKSLMDYVDTEPDETVAQHCVAPEADDPSEPFHAEATSEMCRLSTAVDQPQPDVATTMSPSPIPEHTIQVVDRPETPVDPVDEKLMYADHPSSEVTVESNDTPTLDEPGGADRLDTQTSSCPIESDIVDNLSSTVTALLFSTSKVVTANDEAREYSDLMGTSTHQSSPSPQCTQEPVRDSNGAHCHIRSEYSRHSSSHSDHPPSVRHQSHKSERHHHRHHDRDKRDRSPTSSRRSSSSGVGKSRAHSQHSPSSRRDENARKEHTRDHNHHRSPSTSSRSSASSSSYRHAHHPHHHHHHHHYRHHSRKESSRPREAGLSSMRSDSERSGFHSSSRDHDQMMRTRHT